MSASLFPTHLVLICSYLIQGEVLHISSLLLYPGEKCCISAPFFSTQERSAACQLPSSLPRREELHVSSLLPYPGEKSCMSAPFFPTQKRRAACQLPSSLPRREVLHVSSLLPYPGEKSCMPVLLFPTHLVLDVGKITSACGFSCMSSLLNVY